MLHPSYSDLMKVVNADVEPGETKVVNSRYSIVMATAKRARQIVDGEEALVPDNGDKPLSMAVEELNQGKIKIIAEDELEEFEEDIKAQAAIRAKEILEERAARRKAQEEAAADDESRAAAEISGDAEALDEEYDDEADDAEDTEE